MVVMASSSIFFVATSDIIHLRGYQVINNLTIPNWEKNYTISISKCKGIFIKAQAKFSRGYYRSLLIIIS
jgi:hypothetical protein